MICLIKSLTVFMAVESVFQSNIYDCNFLLKGTNALLCMITGSFVQEYLARKGSDSTEPYSVDAVFSSTSTTNVYTTLNVIILGNLMANKTHNAIIM